MLSIADGRCGRRDGCGAQIESDVGEHPLGAPVGQWRPKLRRGLHREQLPAGDKRNIPIRFLSSCPLLLYVSSPSAPLVHPLCCLCPLCCLLLLAPLSASAAPSRRLPSCELAVWVAAVVRKLSIPGGVAGCLFQRGSKMSNWQARGSASSFVTAVLLCVLTV